MKIRCNWLADECDGWISLCPTNSHANSEKSSPFSGMLRNTCAPVIVAEILLFDRTIEESFKSRPASFARVNVRLTQDHGAIGYRALDNECIDDPETGNSAAYLAAPVTLARPS
jgi:hypothetical protein